MTVMPLLQEFKAHLEGDGAGGDGGWKEGHLAPSPL